MAEVAVITVITSMHMRDRMSTPLDVIATSSLHPTTAASPADSLLPTTKMASTQYLRRSTESLAHDVITLLKQTQSTLAVAESLTGGSIMAALTSISGSSSVFRGGIVSYDTGLKINILKVDKDIISQHGVVHEEVARQMATGIRDITALDTPTTWGVSTTGVAGPEPQDGKPAGTVFIGISGGGRDRALGPFRFEGGRDDIRRETTVEALEQLKKLLNDRATDSS